MSFHPLLLDLSGWPVTVVGGGEVAVEKARAMLAAGADVTVVAADVAPEIEALAAAGRLRREARAYADPDVARARLVFAATGDRDLDAGIAADAARLGVPASVLDDPRHSSFIDPTCFRRGDLTVAVSAGGAGTVFDDRLRRKLELALPPLYGHMADILDRYREKALESLPSRAERVAFLRELAAFLDGPEIHQDLAREHLDGALAGARALLAKHIQRSTSS